MNRFAPLMLALAACTTTTTTPSPATAADPNAVHVLRTYQVPLEHEKTIERLLRDVSYPIEVVGDKGAQTQFAKLNPQLTGNGVIVLSAPVGIHEGVAALIAQVKTSKPRAQATIQTTYWLVLGWPAKEPSIAPELREAAPALQALGELGPQRFELLDRIELAALDGERAEGSSTSIHSIKETAALDGDRIGLRLEMSVAGGQQRTAIQTALTVKPNQFAVLGQAGYTPDKPTLAAQTAGQTGRATLFYVVRARTLP